MKFVKVEKIPEKRIRRRRLYYMFQEFMSSNIKEAKVEFDEGEYSRKSSAGGNLRRSINNYGFPIDVKVINKEVYLVRRDI